MSLPANRESVWDYPRPPVVRPDDRSIRVTNDEQTIAESNRAVRVLETSHPPVFYIPRTDVDMSVLRPNSRSTVCEFKGRAVYWDLDGLRSVAWSYPDPIKGFESIANHLAFYPSKVDCFVGNERVVAQEGDFYGGWITSEVRGPFKGGPGTWGW